MIELEPLKQIPFEVVSPFGLMAAAVFANVFPAIPEEVFLVCFGYLANISPAVFPFFQVMIFLIVGFLLIDTVVYYLAKHGNRIINFLIHRVLDLNLSDKEIFLRQHVNKIIFVSRFLVQLRVVGPVAAAQINYPLRKFLMIDFLALILYVPIFMGAGYYFRESVEHVLSGAHVLRNISLVFLTVIFFIIVIRKLRKVLLQAITDGTTLKKIKSTFGLSDKI